MKKLMGFLFVLVFILGIIFVLLPFLETTPPPSAVPAAQARPRPQIFTSNPLTTLVKRIVNALQTEWDKKREKRRLAVARMQEKRKLAPTNYRAALLKTLPSQEEAPGEPIELPQGEDDGNWLIAPQISPEDTAAKGMHEVSITDEPAQSTETITIPLPQEAAAFSVQSEGLPADSAMQDAPVQLARANSVLDIPLPTSATPEQPSQKAPMGETEKALKELMDVVYPERRLAKLVEDYASVKFGLVPATPASLKEKEAFIKEKKEQVIKEFRRLQWEDIMRMLDSQEPPPPPAKDYLGNYVRAAKREGKETIDLPITIVSKEEEEGKVRLTEMGPTDTGTLQRVAAAVEAAGKEATAREAISSSANSMLSTSKTVVSRFWQHLENEKEGAEEAKGRPSVGGKMQGIAYKKVEIIPSDLNLMEKWDDSAVHWKSEGGESNNVNSRNGDSLLNLSEEFNKDTTELAEGSGEQAERDATLDYDVAFEGSLIGMGLNGNINFYDPKEALQQALEKIQNPLSVLGTNYARNHK